jgi:hypothetical protein
VRIWNPLVLKELVYMLRKFIIGVAASGCALVALPAAAEAQGYYGDRYYGGRYYDGYRGGYYRDGYRRHYDRGYYGRRAYYGGRGYYDNRRGGDGTVGAIIGGAVGALVGREIDRGC